MRYQICDFISCKNRTQIKRILTENFLRKSALSAGNKTIRNYKKKNTSFP